MRIEASLFASEEWEAHRKRQEWKFGMVRQREDEDMDEGMANPNGANSHDGRLMTLESFNDPSLPAAITPVSSFPAISGKRPKNLKKASPMDAFCFNDTFNQLTDKNQQDLQRAFLEYGGKSPSRREIKGLGTRLNLSQSRIRKWFLERSKSSAEFKGLSEMKTYFEPQVLSSRINHIESQIISFQRKIEWLEEELKQSRAYADSLVYFAPSWLLK